MRTRRGRTLEPPKAIPLTRSQQEVTKQQLLATDIIRAIAAFAIARNPGNVRDGVKLKWSHMGMVIITPKNGNKTIKVDARLEPGSTIKQIEADISITNGAVPHCSFTACIQWRDNGAVRNQYTYTLFARQEPDGSITIIDPEAPATPAA